MPATLEELKSFSQFASERISLGESFPSLEECLRQWRADRESQEVIADIQQSLDDVANGRVKPVGQAFDDVRRRLGWRS